MSFADTWENSILTSILGSSVYIGLSTADPSDDGSTLAEPSGGGYARVEIATGDWAAASGGSKATDAVVTFPSPSGNWGTITHACLFDASSGGNLLASGALATAIEVNAGSEAPEFAVGDIAVTLD